jgi:hypothetical protein
MAEHMHSKLKPCMFSCTYEIVFLYEIAIWNMRTRLGGGDGSLSWSVKEGGW